jgi:hypothetical protein
MTIGPAERRDPSGTPGAQATRDRRDLRGLLPREHGSWAYLLIPEIAAILAAPNPAAAILWALAVALFFCAFQGFAAARRRREGWSRAGAIAGAAGGLVLAVPARAHPWALLTLAPSILPVCLGILRARGRIGKDGPIEVLAILATSIMGAGAILTGGGSAREALLLAAACFAYSSLSLIWVRVRLAREMPGRHALLPPGLNIPVSLVLLASSAALGFFTGRFAAGLFPGIYCIRILLPVPRSPDGKLQIVRLGVQEGIAAAFFAVGLGLFLTF